MRCSFMLMEFKWKKGECDDTKNLLVRVDKVFSLWLKMALAIKSICSGSAGDATLFVRHKGDQSNSAHVCKLSERHTTSEGWEINYHASECLFEFLLSSAKKNSSELGFSPAKRTLNFRHMREKLGPSQLLERKHSCGWIRTGERVGREV